MQKIGTLKNTPTVGHLKNCPEVGISVVTRKWVDLLTMSTHILKQTARGGCEKQLPPKRMCSGRLVEFGAAAAIIVQGWGRLWQGFA